jgi:hypothetical protein
MARLIASTRARRSGVSGRRILLNLVVLVGRVTPALDFMRGSCYWCGRFARPR